MRSLRNTNELATRFHNLNTQTKPLMSSSVTENVLQFNAAAATAQSATIGGFQSTVGSYSDSTVEFWLCTPSSARSTKICVFDVRGSTLSNMQVTLGTDNKLTWTLVDSTGSTATVSGVTELEGGRWYHVALTMAGSCYLYVNGRSEGYVSKNMSWATDATITLGNEPGAADNKANLGGCLSELRLWNVQRTQDQLKSLMTTRVKAGAFSELKKVYALTNADPNVTVTGATYGAANMSELRSAGAVLAALGPAVSDKLRYTAEATAMTTQRNELQGQVNNLTSRSLSETTLYFDSAVTTPWKATIAGFGTKVDANGNATVELWYRTPPASANVYQPRYLLDIRKDGASAQMSLTLGTNSKLTWHIEGANASTPADIFGDSPARTPDGTRTTSTTAPTWASRSGATTNLASAARASAASRMSPGWSPSR